MTDMDPVQRRWWRLLEELPGRLGTVHRWTGFDPPPASGQGGLHPNPTSVVCLAGVVRLRRHRVTLDLQAGDALLIAGGVWHQDEPLRAGAVAFGQGFLPTCSDVVLHESRRLWYGRLPSQPSRHLMEAALAQAEARERRRLFGELITQVLAESVTNLAFTHPGLRRMIGTLWSSLHRGVTVAQLLTASDLSRAQAYRLFTSGYGVPPKQAIEQSRLWLAESLLAAGRSRGEAAHDSGFSSTDRLRLARQRAHTGASRRGRSARS